MKKTIIIAVLAAAGIVTYLLNRKRSAAKIASVERTHHLTKAFSKAKKHAVNV
jgi:hypothetical protein